MVNWAVMMNEDHITELSTEGVQLLWIDCVEDLAHKLLVHMQIGTRPDWGQG